MIDNQFTAGIIFGNRIRDDAYVKPNGSTIGDEIRWIGLDPRWCGDGGVAWIILSMAFQVFLAFGVLVIIWGQKESICRFFNLLESTKIAAGLCPLFTRRERFLKWAGSMLNFGGGILDFWRDGSLLCSLINLAVPGACSNPYRHWKRPPSHGQALAFKYLGITPIFTEAELQGKSPNQHQESLLIDYLHQIQQEVSKVCSEETEERIYTSRFLARGMGLITGERYRRTTFYIYPSTQKSRIHEVSVHLKGPYNTSGKATVAFMSNLKNNSARRGSIFEECKKLALKTTSQSTFLRTISLDFGYFKQPDSLTEIPIKVTMEPDRAKVVFITNHTGVHELFLKSDGAHLRGSPFNIQIMENTSGIIDDFETKQEKLLGKSKTIIRKLKSKVINFINETVSYEEFISMNTKVPPVQIVVSDVNEEKCCESKLSPISEVKLENPPENRESRGCSDSVVTSSNRKRDISPIRAFEIKKNVIKNLELIKRAKVQKTNQTIKEEPKRSQTLTINNFNLTKNNNFMSLSVRERRTLIENNSGDDDNDYQFSKSNISSLYITVKERKMCIEQNVEASPKTKSKIENKNKSKDVFIPDLVKCHVRDSSLKKLQHHPDFIASTFESDPNLSLECTNPLTQSKTSPILADIEQEVGKNVEQTFQNLKKDLQKVSSLKRGGLRREGAVDIPENQDTSMSILGLLDCLKLTTSLPNLSCEKNDFLKSEEGMDKTASLQNLAKNQPTREVFKKRKEFWRSLIIEEEIEKTPEEDQRLRYSKSVNDLTFEYKRKNSRKFYMDRYKTASNHELFPSVQKVKAIFDREAQRIGKDVSRSIKKHQFSTIKTVPVKDRIKRFNQESLSKLKQNIEKEEPRLPQSTLTEPKEQNQPKEHLNQEIEATSQQEIQQISKRIKNRFKKAQQFFKQLEKGSLPEKTKSLSNIQIDLDQELVMVNCHQRRHSWDENYKKDKPFSKRGGSLRITNISDRFSIKNLYKDIIGNRKGLFKGRPNQSAAAACLNSMPSNKPNKDISNNNHINLSIFDKALGVEERLHNISASKIFY